MSGELKSHKKEYFIIFFLLAFLTVVELQIPALEISALKKGIGLTGAAVAKAFLVAYFYMHLKSETKWLKFIAAIPISAAFYAFFLVLEGMYR